MIEINNIPPYNIYINSLVDNYLSAGDMIFFDNTHLVTKFIKYMCHTEWSHVGIVIVLENDKKCLLESIFHYIPMRDVFTGDVVTLGCRCVDLKARLKFNKHIGVKKCVVQGQFYENIKKRLFEYAHQNSHKPYESSLFNLLLAWYDGIGSICRPCGLWEDGQQSDIINHDNPIGYGDQGKEDRSGFFCTKLIADALIQTGIINRRIEFNWKKNIYQPVGAGEYIIGNLLVITENYKKILDRYILTDGMAELE